MPIKLKICGLKTLEEIFIINKYDVDYVGFVFSKSKRRITPKHARKIIKFLREDIKKVGVFVNETVDFVNKTVELLNLDIVQLHGDEDENYITKINAPVWKAIKINNSFSPDLLPNTPNITGYLFDNKDAGSGKKFNWDLLKNYKNEKLFILAGGIDSNNVAIAIKNLTPNIIDVSSSLEVNGIKNEEKIIELLRGMKNVK